MQDAKGSLWEYREETKKGSGKFKTILEAKVSPSGYLIYRLYDIDIGNLVKSPFTDILFNSIICLPGFKNYLKQLASGQDINEQLGVVSVKVSGKLKECKVMAMKNVVTVIENDKIFVNIELPLNMAVCRECGKPFIRGDRGKPQVYCSTSCGRLVRVREFRKRQKELVENKI